MIAILLLAGATVSLAAKDDPLIPTTLPDSSKTALRKFLDGMEKPTRWIPEKAKITAFTPGAALSVPTDNKQPIQEYLSLIVPQRAVDAKVGPTRATVYHYRPNPQRGVPGVTVRRTVDLTTGEAVGEPEVLLGYPAPLTREEKAIALRIARESAASVKEMFASVDDEKDVEVSVLFETVSSDGIPGASIGDRVATLLCRVKGKRPIAAVVVNVTRETVRPQVESK